MAVFLSVEVALVTRYFHDRVIGGFLAIGAALFVADAFWLWRNKPYSRKLTMDALGCAAGELLVRRTFR